MIPDEKISAVEKFPSRLQELIRAELAAGNSIVEIGSESSSYLSRRLNSGPIPLWTTSEPHSM